MNVEQANVETKEQLQLKNELRREEWDVFRKRIASR